ncbi:hypothetical protein [Algibacter luteus]|uniref:hypothetical protein n=1 Tax=Algibacter luteus TaxID=1178825 RepID=UPI00259313C4|nr:hypothetical protein [Algibacter luteus]WJJ96342.1 hypothetical protein O5O44_14100 [Algibacter luteus]
MDEIKSIIRKGLKASANRKEVLEAKIEFDKLVIHNVNISKKSIGIYNILRDDINLFRIENPDIKSKQPIQWWYKYDSGSSTFVGAQEAAYDYCVKWISDMLSPTYIHDKSNRKKLDVYGDFNGTKVSLANGHEIVNNLTPITALDFVVDYYADLRNKIWKIIEILA